MEHFIKTSIEKIKTAIDNNKLVIFVGAGVSMNSNCPSWSQLIDKFADELGIPQNDRKDSIEYYLKIPQYYYIERGEKEYFDLVESGINSSDAIPNDIDRLIFQLNPSTVITTNFDDLLEKTIKDEGLFYTVIKQDRDLPYCFNDKLVIKMHGDGILKNIILKEDDYLNYSNKFPLIENYIKGLFSTKTILFVGYSAEDQDFKLLFNLVKEQLGSDFQPAYLLEYGKDLERINFNYYKNRGINILYYNEIKDEIEGMINLPQNSDINNDIGQRLYKFLKYIDCYKEKKDSLIDRVYDKLKIFEEMNAIMQSDVIGALEIQCCYDNFGDEELAIINPTKEFEDIFQKLKDNEESFKKELMEKETVQKILNILLKAGIKSICIYEDFRNKIFFESDLGFKINNKDDELKGLFKEFKYKKLNERIEYYLDDKSIEGNENKFIEKAYYLYHLKKYKSAYNILKKVSTYCFAKKKYSYYFISQLNMKQLIQLIEIDNKFNMKDKKFEEPNIDIQKSYMQLPKKYRNKYKFILELNDFNIFYKEIIRIQENVKKLTKEKKQVENGGVSINSILINSYHNIKNVINYINNNFIMIDHFSNIKMLFSIFVEGIIANYSINIERNVVVNKIKKLDNFIFYIIIKYVQCKELKRYLNEYEVKHIKVDLDSKEYLILGLEQIIDNVDSHIISKLILDFSNAINNIFILLSYIELTLEEFTKIIEISIIALRKNNFDGSNFSELLNMIIKIYNKNNEIIDTKVLMKFIEVFINSLYNRKISSYAYNIMYSERFFGKMSYICKKTDDKVMLSNEVEILGLISELDKNNINDTIIDNLLIPIYAIMNQKCKESFRKFILQYANLRDKEPHYYINLIYKLLDNNIIIYEKDDYKNFFEFTIKYINKQIIQEEKDKKNGINHMEIKNCPKSEMGARICLEIIRNKKLNYNEFKDIFIEVEKTFPIFKFLINRENFNYDLFDISWIEYLSDDEFIKIVTKEDKNGKILKLLSEELEKDNIDKKYRQKISKLILSINKVNLKED